LILNLKLASLYSGGKDSTFAIYHAKEMGHNVVCLLTMHPASDDSLLFHYPNSWVASYLADAMQIPIIGFSVNGKNKENEMKALEEAIAQSKSVYGIEGVLYGGISSNYQKKAFEEVCVRQGLAAIAPLWTIEPLSYMNGLVERRFYVVVVGVSAMGLGKEWLGRVLDNDAISKLASLSKKYGFNLTFEGGEAETLVVDCPLFSKRLEIKKANIRWDGQRGIFEILEVALVDR
jgi:ABC transporter with metal-binding/Fe-S-binding domain ATP-binding protein